MLWAVKGEETIFGLIIFSPLTTEPRIPSFLEVVKQKFVSKILYGFFLEGGEQMLPNAYLFY